MNLLDECKNKIYNVTTYCRFCIYNHPVNSQNLQFDIYFKTLENKKCLRNINAHLVQNSKMLHIYNEFNQLLCANHCTKFGYYQVKGSLNIGGSRGGGGGYGVASPPPPFKFQKKKRVIKQSQKKKWQSSWKGKKEKELHVCLVLMYTRVDTCINKHFFSTFYSSTAPLWKISGSAPVNFWADRPVVWPRDLKSSGDYLSTSIPSLPTIKQKVIRYWVNNT